MDATSLRRLLELGNTIPDDEARAEHESIINDLAKAAGVTLDESAAAEAAAQKAAEKAEQEAAAAAAKEAADAERKAAAAAAAEERAAKDAQRKAADAEAAREAEEKRAAELEARKAARELARAESGNLEDSGAAQEAFARELEALRTRIPKKTDSKSLEIGDEDIHQSYCRIRSDHHEDNWMWLGYGGTENVLKIYGSGAGGYSEMMAEFKAFKEEPLYGYLRYIFGDTDRAKFLFFTYVPDKLGGLRKMKVQNHKPGVDAYLKYYHVSIAAFVDRDLEEKNIVEKLKKAGGADYGTGQGGGTRGQQNFGGIKAQSKTNYQEKEKETNIGPVVFQKGPLTTTPIDLKGRPMVAAASEAQKNTVLALNKK
jgi:hypothetical protein